MVKTNDQCQAVVTEVSTTRGGGLHNIPWRSDETPDEVPAG